MALRKIGNVTTGPVDVRVYRDAEWQEYRARLYINGILQESADYHTDDKDDAFLTASDMVSRANKRISQGAIHAQ